MHVFLAFAVSLSLSAALVSGIALLSQFAFYVCLVMNVFCWLGVLSGQIKGEVAAKIRNKAWVSLISSVIGIGALIYSGHPMLAASSFMVQFILLTKVFSKELA